MTCSDKYLTRKMFSSSGLKAMALGASTKWSARLSPMESCLEYFSTSLSECHSVVWGGESALVFSLQRASFAHLHDCPVGDSAVPRHAVEVEVAVQVVLNPPEVTTS